MLSTSFVFKQLANPDSNEAITKVKWNKTDGWLAFGGDQGMLRILMIETVDGHDFNLQGVAARPSRISVDKKVYIHEGSRVTSINWNEKYEYITSGDVRGSVVVCEYKDSKWQSILVNESVQSPVVNAVWASDGSKILIFYLSGYLLLGASTGHKILSVQLKQSDTAKFAYVSDSCHDFFLVGFETKIIGYNFDGSEKFHIILPYGEKVVSGHLTESPDQQEEPKIVVITMSGLLVIFSAINGIKLAQIHIKVAPSEVVVSPNNYYIAIAGASMEATPQDKNQPQDAEYNAVVKIVRFCDLEYVSQIKIKSKIATCVTWDASSLRLAIGTDYSVYLACMRLSYRHYMLRDGTIAFSLGSSILKTSNQIVYYNKKDECIIFYKNAVNKRWPTGFIDYCSCGEYLAMVCSRVVTRADGATRQFSYVILHTSVGAPVLTVDLNFIPFFMAGSEHYLAVANCSRVSLFDLRFLTGETKDYQNIMETKLDQNQAYTGIVEWHADSSPFAPDRELHVAKQGVSSPITAVCCSNTALFIARQNAVVQRFNLPSLRSNVKIQTGNALKFIRSNCSGTAIAGVSEHGYLQIFYCPDYVEGEYSAAKNQYLLDEYVAQKRAEKKRKMEEKAKEFMERQVGNTMTTSGGKSEMDKMLGFDGGNEGATEAAHVKKVMLAENDEAQLKKVFPPWETQLSDIWGCCWNDEDPNMLAVSSRHRIYVLYIEKRSKEDPITASAHIVAFSGLQVCGVYLDEIVMYLEAKPTNIKLFDTYQLRELKEALYGSPEVVLQMEEQDIANEEPRYVNLITVFNYDFTNMTDEYKHYANISSGINYLKQQQTAHPYLYKIVAEAALKELALDIASTYFLRANDYISYHFVEYVRKIGSDELRRAEVAVFLNDFKQGEYILLKYLGRPDISLRNSQQLCMWFKIIALHKDQEYNSSGVGAQVSDELATYAYKYAGLYYLRQRDYGQAVTMLYKANDTSLLAEAYFRAEMYDDLRYLATTLQPDVNYDAIVYTSKVLARVGDVEGASLALLRLNRPEDAIRTCISLKRFDKAILIAYEFNLLEVVDKHLSEYLRQLLNSGDDKAALDLLRKTNQGEIAACIIIGAAMEDFKYCMDQRNFPLKAGAFNRLRRLVVLAAKEASEVQRRKIVSNLKKNEAAQGLLTDAAATDTLNNLVNEDQPVDEEKQQVLDNQMFSRFGGRAKSTSMIWKLVRQTRYIVLASYMLYMGKPEQALFPAVDASGFYNKLLQSVGNVSNVVDDEYRYLARLALPIAVLAALQVRDFDLASQLLEVLESEETLPSVERDYLEQLAVDIFSKFPPTDEQVVGTRACLYCDKCKAMMYKYSTVCSCGNVVSLCSRTGQPISGKHKTQKCSVCGTHSTQGKAYLSVCPMCHSNFE